MEDPVTLVHCQTSWDDLQKAVKKYGWEKSRKTLGIWTIKEHAEETKQSVSALIKPEISLGTLEHFKKRQKIQQIWTLEGKAGVFSYTGVLKSSMQS